MPGSNISKGVLSVGMWTITRVTASMLATPFISRALGTEGYGQYAYYLSVLFLAAPLANAGTLQSLSRFIAERPDPDRRARVALLSGWICFLGFAVVGALMGWIIAPGVPSDQGWPLIAILLGCLGFDVLWFYARGILYGMHREELAGTAGAAASLLTAAVSAVLAVQGYGISGVFLGLLLGNATMAIRSLVSARRLLPRTTLRAALASDDPSPRGLATFTVMTMLYASLSMMLYRSGVVLVHHLTGDNTATGLFATALQMAEFVWVLVIAVEGVMLQSTARLWHEGRIAEISALVSQALRYVALVTGFLLTFVFVFADDLLVLYFGQPFVGAAPVLRILIPGVFSFSLGRLLGPVLHARGGVLRLAAVVGAATALNALLAFLLVPPWGIMGAAVSTGSAYAVVLLPYAISLRAAGVTTFRGFGPAQQVLAFVATGSLMAAIALIPVAPWLHVLVGGVVGGMAFVALVLRLGLVNLHEIESILANLPPPLSAAGRAGFDHIRPTIILLAGRRNADV
jgi:O-antigen/teichoic acid export membrane protein